MQFNQENGHFLQTSNMEIGNSGKFILEPQYVKIWNTEKRYAHLLEIFGMFFLQFLEKAALLHAANESRNG